MTWLHSISSLSRGRAGSGHGDLSPWLTESVSGGPGTLCDYLFVRALWFRDSQESHLFSGVWLLSQVELAENLRGETLVFSIKGEVITVSFPVSLGGGREGGWWSSPLHRH